MSKKTTYIHAENNNKILSSNEVRLYVPPEPEKMKVIIWGKELCNGAEWYDFLKCVEEKTRENDKLKQQLVEKDKEIKKLNWQLKDKDFIIKNLNHSLSVAPNANAGQRARIDELTKIVKEKDKEIETMKKDSDKNIDYLVEFASLIENEKDCNRMLKALDRVKSGNKYIIDKANQSKTEFAIQELEKVKVNLKDRISMMKNEEHSYLQKVMAWYDICDQINNQIKELRGE